MDNLMKSKDDSWGILGLQNCILNIAKYLDDFCEVHNIDYCLMGGSALGAIRHKGFIPWDDDLDIFMRPDEYSRFREAFIKEGDQFKFYLQEWGDTQGRPAMAKLRLNNSHYVETDLECLDIHKGIFIDIFILHSCPDNKLGHWWQYFWSRYLVLKALANRNYKRRGIIVSMMLKPLKYLPRKAFVKFALNQIYRNHDKITKYFCHYIGRAGYKKGLYKSSYFNKSKRVPFETITLRVPERVEEYLTDRWGDYMNIPSKEEIAYYQHSSDWEVTADNKSVSEKREYADEINLIC